MNAVPPPPAPRLSLPRLFRLARKELRETLRDRRTILTLVLMPLLVYPLLGLTFQKFLLSQAALQERPGRTEYILGFASAEEVHRIDPLLTPAELTRERTDDQWREDAADDDLPPILKPTWPHDEGVDVAGLLAHGLIDVGILMTPENNDEHVGITLLYNPDSIISTNAMREMDHRLRTLNDADYRNRLREAGLGDRPLIAIATQRVPGAGGPAATVAAVLPFILLLMTATGAVYPAIDLTAGERERGTLEALAAAPVSRRAVLAAKYAAVFAVAVLTAGMNLIAMSATVFSLGLDRMLFGGGLTVHSISLIVALVLVLAAFFSAVLLLVTSFARSFKEAQAYLIPVMLVSLAPGIVSMMPDLRLTPMLAVTPLIGIVLLARDLMTGGAHGVLIALCVLSTLFYAAVALLLAARAFGTDAVLYGSEGTWTELFRRPAVAQPAPPMPVAAACLAAVFPGFLLLGPLVARFDEIGIAERLGLNAGVTALLFFVAPTIAAVACHAKLKTTFRLGRPPIIALAGAALLGLSLWPFAYELTLTLSGERIDRFRELFKAIRPQLEAMPLWIKLLTLAVIPAVCEEWFFRGFLLSSLRTRVPAWQAVLASGVLFGAFHVVVRDGLFLERLAPSTFLGIILGIVCVRTGSLWPGMLLHALHNGFLITLSNYETELAALGWSGGERTHLPWSWLAAATAVACLGAFLIWRSRKNQPFGR